MNGLNNIFALNIICRIFFLIFQEIKSQFFFHNHVFKSHHKNIKFHWKMHPVSIFTWLQALKNITVYSFLFIIFGETQCYHFVFATTTIILHAQIKPNWLFQLHRVFASNQFTFALAPLGMGRHSLFGSLREGDRDESVALVLDLLEQGEEHS